MLSCHEVVPHLRRCSYVSRLYPAAGSIPSLCKLHLKTNNAQIRSLLCSLISVKIGTPNLRGARKNYRVFQNYPNMYFSTIISTALKPLKMWIPKFSEILIKRQS